MSEGVAAHSAEQEIALAEAERELQSDAAVLRAGSPMPLGLEVYLDNAATTPPHPEVVRVMADAFEQTYGNPSSLHAYGRAAKRVLEDARATLASCLGIEPDEVFFTSGGTESNNLAICGAARAAGKGAGQLIASSLEHPSVTRSVRGMRREGWDVDYVEAVGGNFDLNQLADHLRKPTLLITTMMVQNELGYRFPLADIVRLRDQLAPRALVHTDAVQAFGKFSLRPGEWGIDLCSISAHKVGGPKGIGALYVRRGTSMFTNAFGGGQERGLRSGTEAVFLAAGFAKAAEIACASLDEENARIRRLWLYLRERLCAEVPDVIINSREDGSPYLFNFTIPGMKNQAALEYLSRKGIYVSKASACESNIHTVPAGTWRPKHPLSLQAAGISRKAGRSTLRVSFGYCTTQAHLDVFVDALKSYLSQN